MENYDKLLKYASSQQSFASYYNSSHENPLKVYQIVSFEIVEENIHEIQCILKDYSSQEHIKFYVEGKNIISDDLDLVEDSIDEKFEFRIEHKLQNLLYPLIFSNVEEFKKFVTECIINLKIISINKIEKKICIKIFGTPSLDMGDSLLFDNEEIGRDFSVLLDTFVLEAQYEKTSCLSIPNLLPNFLVEDNKIKILKAFLQCVCESELNSNEFLVTFSEVNRIF
ncbi:hypothetical protein NAG46_002589, partial [Enterococcus faecium]|nr:hypothetical protein [Enterococcus faecium]